MLRLHRASEMKYNLFYPGLKGQRNDASMSTIINEERFSFLSLLFTLPLVFATCACVSTCV